MTPDGGTKIESLIVELPRVYKRGSPPEMTMTPAVLNELGIKFQYNQNNFAFSILNELYVNKKFSQAKIGDMFGVQADTVRRWMKRVGVPIREQGYAVSQAITKYRRVPFSDNEEEKAYMIGLRYGDLHVQKHGRLVRVSLGTTHRTMLKLFKDTFAKYGSFNQYPKYDKPRKTYGWCTYSDLDGSFDFLLDKSEDMPSWILGDTDMFLSFLSGFFDAEGCISICSDGKTRTELSWIVCSTNRRILEQMMCKLNSLGFHFPPPRLVKKANWHEHSNNARRLIGFAYRKDYWCLRTGIKPDVFNLLSKMKLRHEEKIAKHDLARELMKKDWENAKEKIISLRSKIKTDVGKFVDEARLVWTRKMLAKSPYLLSNQ